MQLSQKSAFNIEAAEKLIKNNLFAPSVHCSYYSCFQIIKHKLINSCNFTFDLIENEVKESKKTRFPISEHTYVRNRISKELESRANNNYEEKKENREVMNALIDLYNFRIDSDYKEVQIDISIANKSIGIAKKVQTYINKKIK